MKEVYLDKLSHKTTTASDFCATRNSSLSLSLSARLSKCLVYLPSALCRFFDHHNGSTSLIFVFAMAAVAWMNIGDSHTVMATASTITINVSDPVSVDVTPSKSGTFSHHAGAISVTTNHISGYTLSIAASSDSDNGALTGTDGVNGTIPTINTACMGSGNTSITLADFSSRTACNNMWGYAPSYYNGAANTNYYPSPNTTGDTLDITNTANPTAKTYSLDIGTRINADTPKGSYSKAFIIYAIGNQVPYTITYNSGLVSGMPSDVSDSTEASTITLASEVPSRDGYAFLGWCTVTPTTTGNTDACTGGTTYQPGATYAFSSGANLNLYAMWGPPPALQNWTGCSSLNTGDTVKLVDNRDGQVYNVGKTADGQCWMLQNLRLGSTVTQANPTLTLTPSNSNISANYTLNYNEQPEGSIFHSYTIDGVDGQNNSTEYYCNNAYGCYYNWYTATAGAGTSYVASGEVNTSICPAGWSLPTQAQFSALYDRYPSASAMLVDNPAAAADNDTNPPKLPGFLLSGYCSGGGVGYFGSNSYYWSRTAGSAQGAYNLDLESSAVNPSGNYDKFFGFAVRCVRQ